MGGRPSFTSILRAAKAECEGCGTTENLSVNHKIPLALGGNNDWTNLEILCRKCHDKYHGTTTRKSKLR
jgi:5-methylcytosine-specific restriction endonuclease McrA